MRSIGRNIQEERLLLVFLNKTQCVLKKHIVCASMVLLKFTVMGISIIKQVISPIIRPLANTASTMDNGFLKPTVYGPERILSSQMPFPDSHGLLPVLCKYFS